MILPVVSVFSSMNDNRPVSIDATLQAGFQFSRNQTNEELCKALPGWKSDILRQSLVEGLKRPLGVIMYIEGGANGYCEGNTSFP